MRQKCKILAYGDYREAVLTNRQYAYVRGLDGQAVVVAVNNDDNESTVHVNGIPDGEYVGLLGEARIQVSGGYMGIHLGANSGEVYIPVNVWDSMDFNLSSSSKSKIKKPSRKSKKTSQPSDAKIMGKMVIEEEFLLGDIACEIDPPQAEDVATTEVVVDATTTDVATEETVDATTDVGFNFGSAASDAAFVNCATDFGEPLNATCKVGTTETMFKNYEKGDYTPNAGGALYNAGVTPSGWEKIADLAGKPRVVGRSVDIGCYEGKAAGFMIYVR